MSTARTRSASQVALQIPEILLQIFSSSPQAALPALSRVCRRFNAPVNSLLYENIAIRWHPGAMELILRSFDANPQLLAIVKSLVVSGGETGIFGESKSLEFLRRLHALRHLSFRHLEANDPRPLMSPSLKKDLNNTMGRLVSLTVERMDSLFWESVFGEANTLEKLELYRCYLPSFGNQRPALRHLLIDNIHFSLSDVGEFALEYIKTLETLRLDFDIGHQENDWLPPKTTFDKLTHLHLCAPPNPEVPHIQSFVRSMPFLRHLRLDGWGDGDINNQ